MSFVVEERKKHTVYPPAEHVFTWTQMCDIQDVGSVLMPDFRLPCFNKRYIDRIIEFFYFFFGKMKKKKKLKKIPNTRFYTKAKMVKDVYKHENALMQGTII